MAVYPKNVLSICAGIGAFDLGLELAFPETRTVCYVEREIAAVEVLVARMEEGSLAPAPIHSNLLTFDGRPWRGVIQAVTAGLPCQPYSVAGRQLGHDDERAIWPAFIRVVGEVQPEVVFLENVPAFLRYFRPVGNELQRMGYVVEEPLLLTASECGASHRRERFFAMAYRSRRGLRELWQPSWCDGLTDWGDAELGDSASDNERWSPDGTHGSWIAAGGPGGNLVHPSRDERDGSHGQARPQRGVCETGNGMADAGDGQLPESGWRPEGRDGTGPADTVLADTQCCRPQREHEPGGAGCGRSEPARDFAAVADPDSVGAVRKSGIVREAPAGTEGARQKWQRDGNATGYAGDKLADPERTEWRENVEHDRYPRGWVEAPGGPRSVGFQLGDSDVAGLEGREQRGCELPDERIAGATGDTRLPLFAPGPGATELWRRILADHPHLAPAISEEEAQRILRGVFAGASSQLDFEDRTDRLRSLGNLAQSLQVAVACLELSSRIAEVA